MAGADPIVEFLDAAERARAHHVDIAPAALAAADSDGRPSVRIVLVRRVDARGFVFFTNYRSRKGTELTANPRAALCFYWPALEQQIRIQGPVERTSSTESDDYWITRPRGAQVGAWASEQSTTLPSEALLQERCRQVEDRFRECVVERPPFWGGFRLVPAQVEFWYGRPDRLHDRILYVRDGDGWSAKRLYP